MTRRKTGAIAAALATLVAIAGIAATSAPAAQSDPIVIGWAFDSKGAMSPFDTSAVASAQLHLKTINKRGGAIYTWRRGSSVKSVRANERRSHSPATVCRSNGANALSKPSRTSPLPAWRRASRRCASAPNRL